MLAGKVALVTGATRGIGRAIAVGLAREGASIVINGRNLGRAQDVAAEITALGRRSLCIQADVSCGREVEQMVAAALETFGRIDILVNNAGVFDRRNPGRERRTAHGLA